MAAPRKENVREVILEVTRGLIGMKSLQEITLAEIARNAGISKGTLYYHFKSKNDILLTMIDEYLNDQWKEAIRWAENDGADVPLYRIAKQFMENCLSGDDVRVQLFGELLRGNELVRARVIESYRQTHSMLVRILSNRSDNLPSEYIAWLLIMAADGLVVQHFVGGNIDSGEFVRQTLVNIRMFEEMLRFRNGLY